MPCILVNTMSRRQGDWERGVTGGDWGELGWGLGVGLNQ